MPQHYNAGNLNVLFFREGWGGVLKVQTRQSCFLLPVSEVPYTFEVLYLFNKYKEKKSLFKLYCPCLVLDMCLLLSFRQILRFT